MVSTSHAVEEVKRTVECARVRMQMTIHYYYYWRRLGNHLAQPKARLCQIGFSFDKQNKWRVKLCSGDGVEDCY